MPTVLRSDPYPFHFYAGDRNEPPHIHVTQPVSFQSNNRFRKREAKRIDRLVLENQEHLLGEWNDFFDN